MKKFFTIVISISLIGFFSCEKKDEFEVVTHEVYNIDTVIKDGCFDYDINDTLNIIPMVHNTLNFEVINDQALVTFGMEYDCLSNDSISLNGNILKVFLLNTQQDELCKCVYNWEIRLNVIEDRGLKLIVYSIKNDNTNVLMEVHGDSF